MYTSQEHFPLSCISRTAESTLIRFWTDISVFKELVIKHEDHRSVCRTTVQKKTKQKQTKPLMLAIPALGMKRWSQLTLHQ